MAEILLSLTIIGVVAAITLPSLTGNINERTWNTQRKALYARFSQAIALMPNLNSYGTLTQEEKDADGNITQSAVDTVTETLITQGLSKVLKINNICDWEHLNDCGLSSNILAMNGSKITLPTKLSELNQYLISGGPGFESYPALQGKLLRDTKAAAFETQNGESILTFYNPNCQYYMNEYSTKTYNYVTFVQPKICANFVYDLNGNKGPNTVGKDIGFMTVLYPTDSLVLAPVPTHPSTIVSVTQFEAMTTCKQKGSDLRPPTLEELISMFVNQKLINGALVSGSSDYWSTRLATNDLAWKQAYHSGGEWIHYRTLRSNMHCVKR